MPPDPRRVAHLLGGHAHACVVGEIEWRPVQGAGLEARLDIYADGYALGTAFVRLHVALTAPELLTCAIVLDDEPVRRACWNRPHRELGMWCEEPTHGHTYNGGAREVYAPDAPLNPIDEDDPDDWARREAVQSFLDWAKIGRDALVWTEPAAGWG